MSFPALAGAVAAAAGTARLVPAGTPQRPDECPDVANHARPQRSGDYRKQRRFRCPSCGFFCLLAPAEAATVRSADEGAS